MASDYSEAELTETKKLLVQKKTLANRIDELGIGYCLLMGSGDTQQNIGQENSVKEDLFEAILGAIAIDCNWDMEKLLGDGSRYNEIKTMNGLTSNLIHAGQTLKLPA